MTAPVSVEALDRGHQAQQVANAMAVQRLVMQLFTKMIDPKNIAGTAQPWLQQTIIAILRGRQSAYLLATAYAMAIRRIQAPDAPPFEIPKLEPLKYSQLVRSLTYTGPGKLAVDLAKTPEPMKPDMELARPGEWDRYERELAQWEQTLKELPAKAALTSSASAYRYVNQAAVDTIDTAVQRDSTAVGYIRITSATPCAFCLMLASRGPVYKGESFKESDPRFTGPGNQKVHDGCSCQLRPLYGTRATSNWTDQARRADQLWVDSAARYSGRDAINAFARAARQAGLADLNRW